MQSLAYVQFFSSFAAIFIPKSVIAPALFIVGSKAVDDILLNLSAQIAGVTFLSGETCFIFDEIQECPEARTALKFFKEDGAFREPCPQRVQPGTDVIIRNHVKTSLRTKYQNNDMTFAHVIFFS